MEYEYGICLSELDHTFLREINEFSVSHEFCLCFKMVTGSLPLEPSYHLFISGFFHYQAIAVYTNTLTAFMAPHFQCWCSGSFPHAYTHTCVL